MATDITWVQGRELATLRQVRTSFVEVVLLRELAWQILLEAEGEALHTQNVANA